MKIELQRRMVDDSRASYRNESKNGGGHMSEDKLTKHTLNANAQTTDFDVLQDSAPAGLVVPAGQGEHFVLFAGLNHPAEHLLHFSDPFM